MVSRRKTKTKAKPKTKATKKGPAVKQVVVPAAKTARLNLLIRPDLKDWAHQYAARQDKSLSSIINDYLLSLRERERGDCVEQI